MKKSYWLLSLLGFFSIGLLIWGCDSVRYVKDELQGGAAPEGGIQEVVSVKRSYPVGSTKLRLEKNRGVFILDRNIKYQRPGK